MKQFTKITLERKKDERELSKVVRFIYALAI